MKFSQMPYKRPNIEESATRLIELTKKVALAQSADEILNLHKEFTNLAKNLSTLNAIAYIRHSIDTKDEFYDTENDFFDENEPLFTKHLLAFYRAVVESGHRKELEEKLGSLWFINAELSLKAFDESIIEELKKENALCSKYDKLLASAEIDFSGETLNLSQLRAHMLSADREVRRRAYAKRSEFFLQNADELDEIYDELVKLRTQMAVKLGYKNFVELGYIRMERNSYSPEHVERFRNQVKKYLVPLLGKMHEQRRVDLQIDKLKFFDEDIYFRHGNPKPKGTPDEMFHAGKKMYTELSSETKEFFDFMQENELFDVLAKKGKSGGGYCHYLPDYKSPFIFANFNGTSEDVDVLTHECGHALCSYIASDIEIMEYQDYTSDIAEIHSMAMEFFTADWMSLFFKEQTNEFLQMQLASALAFIPYGCMVDEFQHIVYENPDMAPGERKIVWQKLEREYKPHLDYDDDKFFGVGGGWQRQAHIYEMPFYYIDYCLAQICAIQYRIWMQTNREAAWQSYIELLRKAGTCKFTDIISEAGLLSPFESGTIEKIAKDATDLLGK